jgi:hypothetical protein
MPAIFVYKTEYEQDSVPLFAMLECGRFQAFNVCLCTLCSHLCRVAFLGTVPDTWYQYIVHTVHGGI